MDMKVKPIPAFYCCYLLRSTVRHASLYIGSSPHPARRLAQHNGQVKGGAVRTSRLSLRPWEMTCIVAGFPSNIAALQFEWAWQNAHLTRHILPDERISFPVTLIKTNKKTGKTRKKPGRPRTSLVERLSNLHLLLRTKYFSQWPLELRFFNEDVFRSWQSWCGRIDTQLRPTIKVILDLAQAKLDQVEFSSAQQPVKRKKAELIGKGGVDGVDPTYARYRDVFEKERFLLDDSDEHRCDLCSGPIDLESDLFAICTTNNCPSLSHVTCLSDRFLHEQHFTSMIPTSGHCPRCSAELEWSDIMRVTSLRMRGQKEVLRLLKKRRTSTAITAAEIMDEAEVEDSESDVGAHTSGSKARTDDVGPSTKFGDSDDNDDNVSDDDEDDDNDHSSVSSFGSARSLDTILKSPSRKRKDPNRLEIVIEDSEEEP